MRVGDVKLLNGLVMVSSSPPSPPPCSKTDRNISALQALGIGTTARGFAAWCFLPITVIKTRYEVSYFPLQVHIENCAS